jgi:hypothetical protein
VELLRHDLGTPTLDPDQLRQTTAVVRRYQQTGLPDVKLDGPETRHQQQR